MIGILSVSMLFISFFWTCGFARKTKLRRSRINLLTRKETFYLESVFLVFLILDSSSVFLDHLFNQETRLTIVLSISAIFDLFILLILPTVLLLRSVDNYPYLWTDKNFQIKQLKFKTHSSPLEPRREIFIKQTKLKKHRFIQIREYQSDTKLDWAVRPTFWSFRTLPA